MIWSSMCVAIEVVILAGVYFAGIEQGRQAAFNAKTPLMPSNGIGVGP